MISPSDHDRILLLYLRTGGGHMAAARAVDERISERFPEAQTFLTDGIPSESWSQRMLIESGYRVTGIRYPVFWPGIYEVSKARYVQDALEYIMGWYSNAHIRRSIERNRINKIVVFHYLLARPVRQVLRQLQLRIPVLVVVTDPFSAHPMWFYRHRFRTIVFSNRAKDDAVRGGYIDPSLVKIFPPILNRRFDTVATPDSIASLRKRIGLDSDRPYVLIAAGGDGLPNGANIVRAICDADIEADVCVVCGRDQALRNAADRASRSRHGKRIAVFGFVDFVHELMSGACVVVTKAGPAMVMEALMLRKPLIVSSYVYGQERGNVDFVTRNRLGHYETNARKIAGIVSSIIAGNYDFDSLSRRVDSVGLQNGTKQIVDRIMVESVRGCG